jgi:hypothetical protein
MSSGSISHHANTGRFRSRDGVSAAGGRRQRTGILSHSGSNYWKRWGWIAMRPVSSPGVASHPGSRPLRRFPSSTCRSAGSSSIHSDFRLPQRHRLIDALARQRDEVAATLGTSHAPTNSFTSISSATWSKFHDQLERIYPGLELRRAVFVKSDRQLVVLAHWGTGSPKTCGMRSLMPICTRSFPRYPALVG